jgi:hypothetical protein
VRVGVGVGSGAARRHAADTTESPPAANAARKMRRLTPRRALECMNLFMPITVPQEDEKEKKWAAWVAFPQVAHFLPRASQRRGFSSNAAKEKACDAPSTYGNATNGTAQPPSNSTRIV